MAVSFCICPSVSFLTSWFVADRRVLRLFVQRVCRLRAACLLFCLWLVEVLREKVRRDRFLRRGELAFLGEWSRL